MGNCLMADREEFCDQAKQADDWLAAFSKKSQEALAQRAAEKSAAPLPDESALVEALARKSDTEYDKVRTEIAGTLGIRVSTLDDRVAALRDAQNAADKPGPAHWSVELASESVDGATLLEDLRKYFRRHVVLPPNA